MKDTKDPNEGRTKCLVYSRCVGFIRPINNWNDSKQVEFKERKTFVEAKAKGNNLPV